MTQADTARSWSGATVVVTGGGGGLGAAVATAAASAGANIVLVGRDEKKLQATAANIKSETLCIAGDLASSDFCQKVADHAVEKFGRLDVLVNNAGAIFRGSAAATPDDAWTEVMRVNCDAVFWLCRAAASYLQNGAVVNVASTCGLVGVSGLAAYCASKGAVVQLTRTLALEFAAHGTTVNAVCPGAIDTPMLFSQHPAGRTDEQTRTANAAAIPHGRIANAAEVARAVLFLASEPHITGVALPIDGGYTAQ